MLLTHVEFRSDDSPPCDAEAEEVNPGRYGKRLAEYLLASLREQGQSVGDIFPEDWGWVVPIEHDAFDLWIGVGNYDEYPDGFLCFIEPHREYVRRFPRIWRKISTAQRVRELQQSLDKALTSHDGISGVKWWTHEEFNDPIVGGSG